MRNRRSKRFWVLLVVMAWLVLPVLVFAKEAAQEWDLVNPEGVVKLVPIKMAARISTLQGKTVGLKWNAKPNGNLFLDRVAELLKEQVKDIRIVKFYENEATTVPQSTSLAEAAQKAKIIARYKPDLVIGSQCD